MWRRCEAEHCLILTVVICRTRVREANRRLLEERQRGSGANGPAQARRSSTAGQQGAGSGGGRGDNACVVCLEQTPDTVFRECGHMAVCWDCGQLLDRCPICRTPSRTVKVYTV